jgi:hypothetical protein
MCTAPRRKPKTNFRDNGCLPAEVRQSQPAQPSTQCRWIDGAGHEWLFTRDGEILVVERPNARGSVLIRFPELGRGHHDPQVSEAWVLFETPDGHLLHSSVCGDVGAIEFSRSEEPCPEKTSPNEPNSRWFTTGVIGE